MRMPTNRPPIHPGEILLEEFIKPYGMTLEEFSHRIDISVEQVQAIINGKTGINAEMALRLSRLFGTSPELWLNGQMKWELWHLSHGECAKQLEKLKPIVVSPKFAVLT